MQSSRRHLLLMSITFAPAVLLGFPSQDNPNPNPVPGTRRRPTDPDDASNGSNSSNFPAAGNKAMLEERQKNIKKNVEKLYQLAAQLKTEVEKTDSTTTLSLAMLKKAEEIEKLAKQIKDQAKG